MKNPNQFGLPLETTIHNVMAGLSKQGIIGFIGFRIRTFGRPDYHMNALIP